MQSKRQRAHARAPVTHLASSGRTSDSPSFDHSNGDQKKKNAPPHRPAPPRPFSPTHTPSHPVLSCIARAEQRRNDPIIHSIIFLPSFFLPNKTLCVGSSESSHAFLTGVSLLGCTRALVTHFSHGHGRLACTALVRSIPLYRRS